MFQLAVTAGLRVGELTALQVRDVHLDVGAHVLCRGKGRKNRTTPLDRQTVQVLKAFTNETSKSSDLPPVCWRLELVGYQDHRCLSHDPFSLSATPSRACSGPQAPSSVVCLTVSRTGASLAVAGIDKFCPAA